MEQEIQKESGCTTNKFKKIISTPHLKMIGLSLLSAFLVVTLYFTNLSFLYPSYSVDGMATDSYFFMLTGKMMAEGKLPYVDFSDHKGIIVFFLQEVGWIIGRRTGVAFINFIEVFLSSYLSLLCVKELFDFKIKEQILASLIFVLLFCLVLGGNAVSLIPLPFCILATYFYIKSIRRNDRKSMLIGSLIAGLSIGIAFNTRPTDGLASLGLYLYCFIWFLKNRKEYKFDLIFNILLALGGFILPQLIIYPIAYVRGYMKEMIQANFLDNISYLGYSSYLIPTLLCMSAVILFGALSIFLILKIKKKDKDLASFLLITLIPNLIFSIIFAKFTHYWISYFGFIVLILISFLHYYPLTIKKKEATNILNISLASLNLIIGFTVFGIFKLGDESMTFSDAFQKSVYDEVSENITEEELKTKDKVLFLDTNCGIIIKSDNDTSLTIKAYHDSFSKFNDKAKSEILNYLDNVKPTYIVLNEAPEYNDTKETVYSSYIYSHYSPMKDSHPKNNIRVFKLN